MTIPAWTRFDHYGVAGMRPDNNRAATPILVGPDKVNRAKRLDAVKLNII